GEVVGVQEQEHAAAGLVADAAGLFVIGGLREQQRRAAAARRDEHPALAGAERGVLEQLKAHDARVVVDRLVVVANDEGNMGDCLVQKSGPQPLSDAVCTLYGAAAPACGPTSSKRTFWIAYAFQSR